MFKKNNFGFGMILGIASTVAFFCVFYALLFLVVSLSGLRPFLSADKLGLLAIAPNFIWVRVYYKNLGMEASGRGLLMITFALVMIFFLFRHVLGSLNLPGILQL